MVGEPAEPFRRPFCISSRRCEICPWRRCLLFLNPFFLTWIERHKGHFLYSKLLNSWNPYRIRLSAVFSLKVVLYAEILQNSTAVAPAQAGAQSEVQLQFLFHRRESGWMILRRCLFSTASCLCGRRMNERFYAVSSVCSKSSKRSACFAALSVISASV